MRYRTINKIRANLTGYFWIPCPRCGQMFGGHEDGGTDWELGVPCGRTTCPDCPGERTLIDGSWRSGHWWIDEAQRLVGRESA